MLGTVKVADQLPLEPTLMLLLPMLTFAPLKVTPELWLIVPPPVNPEPEIVTDVPAGPLVGERVMASHGRWLRPTLPAASDRHRL